MKVYLKRPKFPMSCTEIMKFNDKLRKKFPELNQWSYSRLRKTLVLEFKGWEETHIKTPLDKKELKDEGKRVKVELERFENMIFEDPL